MGYKNGFANTSIRTTSFLYWLYQCCGSMAFWCGSGSGSGSADPSLWLMDPDPDTDPDPAIFFLDLQDVNRKLIWEKKFLHITFWRYIIFKGEKLKKKLQNSRNHDFSYYFFLIIEGSGSGSISLTKESGSGSWRPKNIGESDPQHWIVQCTCVCDACTAFSRNNTEVMGYHNRLGSRNVIH